jgi:cysteine sulfinate desulfinase/cysteine desulfurase-like protein
MGLPQAVLHSSLRLSLGATSTEAEVLEAAQRIIKTVNDLRRLKTARKTPAPPPQLV